MPSLPSLRPLALLCALLVLSPLVRATEATADADWQAVEQTFNATAANSGQPRPPQDQPAEVARWGLRYYRALFTAGLAFYEKHPDDPRRWQAVRQMQDKRGWVESLRDTPEVRAAADEIIPEAERSAWMLKVRELAAAALTASDTPPDVRLYFDAAQTLVPLYRAAFQALREKKPVDFAPIRAELDRLLARYPEENALMSYASTLVKVRTTAGATEAEIRQLWQEFAAGPNAPLRDHAQGQLRLLDLMAKPIELTFTAVDGREVDLAKLRGKVVLIDFWATWCGPCKAELPNVKKVYAAYHDKGFEVVGIALENGQLAPKDTPEQTAAKLAKAKQVLADFTAKEEMPWPQYFDGKFWKNDLSTRYGITSIPAMFLLDQEGKVVSTNARGEKLEAEVKRLLKL